MTWTRPLLQTALRQITPSTGCAATAILVPMTRQRGLAPFGGVLFFYTHGHLFGVKSGYERIAEYAADRGADVVLFGHTHYKTLRHGTPFSPALFNPGSLRDTHSYGVITITDGQCSFEWKQVPEQW